MDIRDGHPAEMSRPAYAFRGCKASPTGLTEGLRFMLLWQSDCKGAE